MQNCASVQIAILCVQIAVCEMLSVIFFTYNGVKCKQHHKFGINIHCHRFLSLAKSLHLYILLFLIQTVGTVGLK